MQIENTQVFSITREPIFYLYYSIQGGKINVYDYESSCYMAGQYSSLFDHGVSGHIDFGESGDGVIELHDYKRNSSLQATYRGMDISLCDY